MTEPKREESLLKQMEQASTVVTFRNYKLMNKLLKGRVPSRSK